MTTKEPAQRRHESPEVGDAIGRMLRGLVTRASEGDTEAIEQLAKVERLASTATTLALHLAHERQPYSWTLLADMVGTTRQAVRQRVDRLDVRRLQLGVGHVLIPGHTKALCSMCQLGGVQ